MDFDPQAYGDPTQHFGDLYTLKQSLGKGSFGRVVHCVNKATGLECAVKIINKTEMTMDLEAAAGEAQILASLNHPNVVRFQGIHHNKHHIFIQMELLRGGNLAERLKQGPLSDQEAASVMRGMLSAVSYLHSREILHRDLKPDNIMFLNKELSSVKVVDFGLSAKFGQHVFAKTFEDMCGTVSFMAPEQIMHRNYSKPVDIWSCAIILYMVITRKHPLLEQGDTVQVYTQKLHSPDWKFPEGFNPLAKQLFLHMTNMQALERYTADQALRHPWITREQTEIPKTYLERISEYNAELQLKRVISAFVSLGVVLYLRNGAVPLPQPKPRALPPVVILPPPVSGLPKFLSSPFLSPSSNRRSSIKVEPQKRTELRRRSTDFIGLTFAQKSPIKIDEKKSHSPMPLKSSATLRPTNSSYLRKPRGSPGADRKTN